MIYTIGHSNHTFEAFAALLSGHAIEYVVDVRSAPVSKYATQFDKDQLERRLSSGLPNYVFKGDQLGGRPADPELYDSQGYVLYDRVARSYNFERGIEWIFTTMTENRLALLCSEENPALCHRHLLIARVLVTQGAEVQHIRGDSRLESYEQVVEAVERVHPNRSQADLFGSDQVIEWKSLRSVLRENRPRPFSGF